MQTIALELVPPNLDDGEAKAVEDGRKVTECAAACGIEGRIGHVMIPGLIAEEEDRPLPMRPKMDTLDFWQTIRPELPGVRGLCTQVSAFMDADRLADRLRALTGSGMDGVIFVGVPRTMADGEGPGVAPTDALAQFRDVLPNRGVILIPTRADELGRMAFKCERGATFGMTQLLYSDAIVGFLSDFAAKTPHRPEILLSFGYVPSVESRLGLIDWLIKDDGNPAVAPEQALVARLAESPADERKRVMLDLYKRVVDGVQGLGFPLSLHLEAPYGVSMPAFDTFAEMLAYWSP